MPQLIGRRYVIEYAISRCLFILYFFRQHRIFTLIAVYEMILLFASSMA